MRRPEVRSNAQLLPTLFDRLRDDAPGRAFENPSDYTVGPGKLRDIVKRDLVALLNTTNVEDLIDRRRYPEAAASTINFGVPALAGSHLAQRKWADIERIVRRAISDFEPRLIPQTVAVRPISRSGTEDGAAAYNVLHFEIHAMIDAKPYPLELTVQSCVDLETNRMSVARAFSGPARVAR